MHSKYQKIDDKIVVLENNQAKFFNTLENYEEFITEYIKGDKLKTWKQVKYLFGGVYKAFVNDVYQDVREAHKELAEIFLIHSNVIPFEDIDKQIEIYSKVRSENPILAKDKIQAWRGGLVKQSLKITWVQSVGSLTKKELKHYIDLIVKKAAEIGIDILTPDEYWESLKMNFNN